MKRSFFRILFPALLLIFAWGIYRHYHDATPYEGLSVSQAIPPGYIFTLETDDARSAWKKIHQNILFTDLKQSRRFDFLQPIDSLLTIYILEKKTTRGFFKNRPFAMSAHIVAGNDYDFLYILDLKQHIPAEQIVSILKKLAPSHIAFQSIGTKKHPAWKVTGLTDDPLYFSLRKNLFLFSFSYQIIRQSILHHSTAPSSSPAGVDGLIRFRFQYEKLPLFLQTFGLETGSLTYGLSHNLRQSLLAIDQEDRTVEASGYTMADSLSQIPDIMHQSGSATWKAYRILPRSTMIYTAFLTDHFDDFYRQILDLSFRQNPERQQKYRQYEKQLKDYLNIDIQRDMISWIGDETGVAKWSTKPGSQCVAVLIRADDIDYARERLLHINKMLRKRSPVRFNSYRHEGHTIYYLHQKKLFKMIFGNWLPGMSTPYFTFIDDFVVFSNAARDLEYMIDSYKKHQTWKHQTAFRPVLKSSDKSLHLLSIIRSPLLYNYSYRSASPAMRRSLSDFYRLFHDMDYMVAGWKAENEEKIKTDFYFFLRPGND